MTQTHNILLMISKFPPEYSGPGVRIPRLYDWLKTRDKNYSLSIICNGIEQTKSKEYQHKNYPVKRVSVDSLQVFFKLCPFFSKRYKNAIYYQFEFIKTFFILLFSSKYKKIKLLHVAGHSGGTAASLVWAKIQNIPVLMELVTANAPYRQKFFFMFKTPKIKNLTVISLTKDMEQKCLEAGLGRSKIWTRPNPINEEKFCIVSPEDKKKLREELLSFSEDQIVLVNIAKMMPQKNQLLILEVLKCLPTKYTALIAGPIISDGSLRDRDIQYVEHLQDLITKYSLQKRVQLIMDFVPADSYIKAGDIYLMPAWNEGFGTPMIEALGCGLPVIANKDEPAFQEWVRNEDNGFLCDINDPKAWAEAIKKFEQFSDDKRRKISQSIRKNAGQETIYSHYEERINQMITGGRKNVS